jgi:hypothetical protein
MNGFFKEQLRREEAGYVDIESIARNTGPDVEK